MAFITTRRGTKAVTRRLLLVVLYILAFIGYSGYPAAADETAERYRLISSEMPAAFERKLQTAALEGFHLLAAVRGTSLSGKGRGVALLEQDADRPLAEYAIVTTSGDFAAASTDPRLKDLAADGYRLKMRGVLPDTADDWWVPPAGYENQVWLILERQGPGGAYAYDAFGYETPAAFTREISTRLDNGFEVLGIINSARRLRVLLERSLAADNGDGAEAARSAPKPVAPQGRYRMLLGSRKLGVRMQLNDAAAEGYRLAGIADASTIAPPMLLVEKRADPMEEHVYRTLYEPGVKIYKDKLDRKLNKRARKGLRVVPGGITATVVVLERSDQRVEYRTLSSRTRPGLAQQMARSADDGFRLVAMFVNGDETTLVVERATDPT